MFKRRTSRVSQRRQVIELKAHVMSPRIAWLGVVQCLRKLFRVVLVLALVAAVVWGARLGFRRGLVENDEFRIQAIELNPNPAIDERGLVDLAGIDLSGSLFDCDAMEITQRLKALPELAFASVHREFPGTLVVKVRAREPKAWIASEVHGILPRDRQRGMLVDSDGIAFRCPERLFEQAAQLPVFHLGKDGVQPSLGETVVDPEFDRLKGLYDIACREIPGAPEWIDSLRQSRSWALEMRSRDGTTAFFGLGDHPRQVGDLKASLDHARSRGEQIVSIELIPERNLPVVVRGDSVPRAILIEETGAVGTERGRRVNHSDKLIHR